MGHLQLSVDDEENINVQGYRLSKARVCLCSVGVLLSCGILWIAMYCRKSFFIVCTHVPHQLLGATKVLLTDSYGKEFVSEVVPVDESSQQVSFYYKKLKYIWDEKLSKFYPLEEFGGMSCSKLHSSIEGLNSETAKIKLKKYGENSIRIKVKPVHQLILREIVSPFYMYQAFIVIVWCLQYYYQFAICIFVLSVVSVMATVWETRKQSISLRNSVRSASTAAVVRDGKVKQMCSDDLVPGDVIELGTSAFTIACDAVLLSGDCVVNESMLTGESTPVTKVSLEKSDAKFDFNSTHKQNILFSGTKVLLTRGQIAKALVYRTGFSTVRGTMVRTILYPRPLKLELHSDLLKCMLIFFITGIPALVYTAMSGIRLGAHTYDTVLFVLNVVTFFVPPNLPAVLTSIHQQAQKRLRNQGVFCLNSRLIAQAAGLDAVCFDKTGTLTEDNLDVLEALPVQNKNFLSPRLVPECGEEFVKALATCHSLSWIEGELSGYNLDIKLFSATGWSLQRPSAEASIPEDTASRVVLSNPPSSPEKVTIVRECPFDSSLKRMSVVISNKNSCFEVSLKGAAEVVTTLCQPHTVPKDLAKRLTFYGSQGYRIIAFAYKYLTEDISLEDVGNLSRESLETDLMFLGLVVLENRLKEKTIQSLLELREAKIRSVMVTGDNLLTALTVGRKCGIVKETVIIVEAAFIQRLEVTYTDPERPDTQGMSGKMDVSLAVDGDSFNIIRTHDPELLQKLVLKGAIFARMSPTNKLWLVECLQNIGYRVGMCGDGANDCGALKMADAGISLSMAEGSVAAPYTYCRGDISCVPTLIREGRATLVSIFDSFRYMTCYSFTFLIAILFLFWDGQKPSDGAYVWIDIVLNLALPFLFGATSAFPRLSEHPPNARLFSFLPMFSIASFLGIQITLHFFAYKYCIRQTWYNPFKFDHREAHQPESSHSGTTILTINMMAYVTAATIFSTGAPFRNTFFTNRLYFIALVIQFVLVTWLALYPPEFMITFLNFERAPDESYNLKLYGICIGVMIFCFLYEKCVVQYLLKRLVQRMRTAPQHEQLLQQLQNNKWPLSTT